MKGNMIMAVEIQATYLGHFVLPAPYNFIRISDPGTYVEDGVSVCVYPDLPFWRYRNFIRHYWSRVAISVSVYTFCNSTTAQHDGQVKHLGLNQEDLPTNYCSDTQNVPYLRRTSFSSWTAYLLAEPLAISCWVYYIISEIFFCQMRIRRSYALYGPCLLTALIFQRNKYITI